MTDTSANPLWDDLRIVKAIAEGGSLVAAATALGLNHSTVSRRLSAVERALGAVLFDRRRSGYGPTAAGEEVIALASRIELDILSMTKRVSSHADSQKGNLRITTSDALVRDFVIPIVADFRTRNPGVQIEMMVGNKPLNLARGDSDIAIRATLAPPENLFGRKLGTVAWAIYGRAADSANGSPAGDIIDRRPWVSYCRDLSGLKAFSFIDEHVDPCNIVYRSDSIIGVVSAITAGIGIGLLPCMYGDLVTGITRLSPVLPEVYDELWLLTHPDIRKSGRVSAFMAHCAEAIIGRRELIEGRAVYRGHSVGASPSPGGSRLSWV